MSVTVRVPGCPVKSYLGARAVPEGISSAARGRSVTGWLAVAQPRLWRLNMWR